MRLLSCAATFGVALSLASVCNAQTPASNSPIEAPSESPFSVPPKDAPELAPRGEYAVGVRTVEIKNPGQPDILNFDKATGKAPLYDRPLTVEVWYPATLLTGQEE